MCVDLRVVVAMSSPAQEVHYMVTLDFLRLLKYTHFKH